jgi:Squalene-hopene cyclase C-terminal domain
MRPTWLALPLVMTLGLPLPALAQNGPGAEAIESGLDWLARHQSENGSWQSDEWDANCAAGDGCHGPGANDGDGRYDVGVTSMALLSFLGHGMTHRHGPHRRVVSRALEWLQAQQRPDGSIGFDRGETVYNHALACSALSTAYALSRDATLEAPAQRAVDWAVQAQNPGLGWKYGVRTGRNDTSITSWMVLGLKDARVAGLEVPDECFAGASRWFVRATDSRGDVGYETPGGGSAFLPQNDGRYDQVPAMTAASVIGRIFCGERRSEEGIRQGAAIIQRSLPAWTEDNTRAVNFDYWFFGTYAAYQFGGSTWDAWRPALEDVLLANQRQDGCVAGSWDPVGEWCLAGGRVYATALGVLSLQIVARSQR